MPDTHPYTVKFVEDAHCRTLHGGVVGHCASQREPLVAKNEAVSQERDQAVSWLLPLFQVKAAARPPTGNLLRDRTEGSRIFQVIGVDFAGPIKYRLTQKREGKLYIILNACSLTQAPYLELSKSMETSEFLRSLKRLVARKVRPQKIFSDNVKTFVAAASCATVSSAR